MSKGSFATTVTCMDGRVQLPVNDWMRAEFGVDYVDTITEPGPDGILARGDIELTQSIRWRVEVSVNGHGSRTVVVVAHADCAGHPVSKEQHLQDLQTSLDILRKWDLPIRLVGVWLGEDWKVEVMYDSQSTC